MTKMDNVGLIRVDTRRYPDGEVDGHEIYDIKETNYYLHQCPKCNKVVISSNRVEVCPRC